jgi:hypothetical protein
LFYLGVALDERTASIVPVPQDPNARKIIWICRAHRSSDQSGDKERSGVAESQHGKITELMSGPLSRISDLLAEPVVVCTRLSNEPIELRIFPSITIKRRAVDKSQRPISTETTAQHQAGNQDGTNFRLTESKENRARAMNKADVCRQLHNAAEFHLFGAGSWPADRESAGAFWKLLDDFGLTANVPDGAWHDPIHSTMEWDDTSEPWLIRRGSAALAIRMISS